jgi:hypothetical protein
MRGRALRHDLAEENASTERDSASFPLPREITRWLGKTIYFKKKKGGKERKKR